MKTKPLVDLALYDPTIKPDSTLSATDLQAFSKIADLEAPNAFETIATFESDQWLLDGSRELLPADTTNVHAGWFSTSLADASGDFATPPELTVDFSVVHDLTGLTLAFSEATGEWATSVHVDYYNNAYALIEDHDYTPSAAEFYVAQAVSAVRRIVLTFNSVNLPYHHLKLKSIDYGKVLHFTGEDIKTCTVVEQIDPLTNSLPIGTLELTLHTSETDFNIVDPAGDFFELQNRQPLDVYEEVGGSRIFIGEFFLDDWSNPSDYEITFRAVDLIGILDQTSYLGRNWTSGTDTIASVMAEILVPLGIPYTLDGILDADEVLGWVPVCTVRQALQLLLSSVSGTVICARSNVLNFKRLALPPSLPTIAYVLSTWDYAITAAEKGAEQSLTLKPLVTGVEYTSWNQWEPDSSPTEMLNQNMAAGTYTIQFNRPVVPGASLTVTGATFVTKSENYCIITVAASGTVVISAHEYKVKKTVKGVYNTVDATVKPNIMRVTENSCVWSGTVYAVATRLLNYLNKRYVQKMKMYAPVVKVGDALLIDTLNNRQVWAVVEKMELDLAGGFVAKVEAVGIIKDL